MRIEEMTWPGVEEYFREHKTVILPLGAVEQHGPVLPLGTDTLVAEAMARELGRKAGRLVAPVLSPGISLTPHMLFSGTVSFRPATFTLMIQEVVESLYRHGARNFLLVNGHGGNDGAVMNALIELRDRLTGLRCAAANWWNMAPVQEWFGENFGRNIGHGCAAEASLILHLDETLVARPLEGRDFARVPYKVSNDLARECITECGIMSGDLEGASKEAGARIFELALSEYERMLAELEA